MDGWCTGRNGEGKVYRRRRRVGEGVEEGKGGEEKGTEEWGNEGGEGLCSFKKALVLDFL